jgi:malonyl-CoA O-methyltransferase
MPEPSPKSLKSRVRDSFDRAADTYDAAAVVQRRVCQRLLDELELRHAATLAAPRILDAGCGTGYGARLLHARWPGAVIANADFAPAMLALARASRNRRDDGDENYDSDANATYCAADIEHLPFAAASFDVWWSSLAIQWCQPTAVFAEAARVLRPGGALAVSTLGPRTFAELDDAFAGIDAHRHTLAFCDPATIAGALAHAGFSDVRIVRETHAVHYPDLKTLLRAVKAVGAHNVGDGARSGMLGRRAWQRVEAAYEAHRSAAGLPASYDVILAYAIRTR